MMRRDEVLPTKKAAASEFVWLMIRGQGTLATNLVPHRRSGQQEIGQAGSTSQEADEKVVHVRRPGACAQPMPCTTTTSQLTCLPRSSSPPPPPCWHRRRLVRPWSCASSPQSLQPESLGPSAEPAAALPWRPRICPPELWLGTPPPAAACMALLGAGLPRKQDGAGAAGQEYWVSCRPPPAQHHDCRVTFCSCSPTPGLKQDTVFLKTEAYEVCNVKEAGGGIRHSGLREQGDLDTHRHELRAVVLVLP